MGRQDAEDSCTIGTAQVDDCRDGDHAYASSSVSGNAQIFQPEESRTSSSSLRLDYFAETSTPTPTPFTIIASRPPANDDEVHKVGRTTGWSHGSVQWASTADPACPGDPISTYHKMVEDDEYWKCLTRADFVSEGGDSGAPVFVRPSNTSNNVFLVGVNFGGSRDTGARFFIPIDRVYAESLDRGYDWKPAALRVVPVVDVVLGQGVLEYVTKTLNGTKVLAKFHAKDFGSVVLHYKAALFKNGTRVTSVGEVTSFPEGQGDSTIRYAIFDISGLSASQRVGDFTVAVRACTDAAFTTCGGYGPQGKVLPISP